MQIPPVTGSHQTQAGIGHRQPPVTDSHRAQAATGHRQPPVTDRQPLTGM